MDILRTIERISRLHQLIKEERTGSPDYLAQRLGISRASLYRMIDELKSYDAPIEYSRTLESFYYTKGFELKIYCSLELIENEDMLKNIVGGCYFFFPYHI